MSGKIHDQLGRPIPGMFAIYFPGDASLGAFASSEIARSDSAGSYSVELFSGTWNVLLSPSLNFGYSRTKVSSRVTVSRQHSKFDFTMSGFRVEGRVIAPTGAVLDSADVFASKDSEYHVVASSRFRSAKFFLFLPADTYVLLIYPAYSLSGFPPLRLSGVSVQADTTFDIPLGGDPVTGTVHGPGGVPLGNVLVTASGGSEAERGRTAADGTYALYAHPGSFRFTCEPGPADSYILTRISTLWSVNGPTTLDFDLSGVEWTGTVRSSATLSPIADVGVRAQLFGDYYERFAWATTGTSGQFRLVLEPNREYSLSFHSPATADLTYPGFLAVNDTTFDVLLDPAAVP